MRSLAALTLALTLLAPGLARADDLEGTWSLRGRGTLLQRRSATLELAPTRAGEYRAVRTIEVAGRPVQLDGSARRRGATVEVRFPRPGGMTAALLGRTGAADLTGRYILVGSRLVGGCEWPQGSGASWTWEQGTRSAAAAAPAVRPPVTRTPAALEGRLRVDGERIVDRHGRTVLLRGVNAGSKGAPFLPAHDDAAAVALARSSGANLVRLYVAWRAIEPRPLRYDDVYIDQVAAAVRRFRAAGMHVVIDMHQDAWGGAVTGHGAPEWATLAAGEPALGLPAGAPWQLRYADRRVWGSFEALYADRPVPATGLGLQEHLARAWARLAARLRAEDAVAGYDLLNEPSHGAEMRGVVVRLAASAAPSVVLGGVTAGVRSLFGGTPFQDELTRALLELAREPARFDRVARSLSAPTATAERRLSRVYGRLGAAIRAVDPGRPLFIEPIALAGVGVPTSLPRPVSPSGAALDQVVYAPHLYDAFVDSGQPWDGDPRRLARALDRHLAHARALGVPLVVGEWGHLNPSARDPAGVARAALDLLDDARVGAAYWEHRPGDSSGPLFPLAVRPYPARVAGRLVSARFDPAARRYVARLVADATLGAPTVISAPTLIWPTAPRVRVSAGDAAHDPALGVVLVWGSGPIDVTIEP